MPTLLEAVERRDTALAQRLLEKEGADPNAPAERPPLLVAAALGDVSTCEVLLRYKAEVNIAVPIEHAVDTKREVSAGGASKATTPLHAAIDNGNLKLLELLFSHKADVDFPQQSEPSSRTDDGAASNNGTARDVRECAVIRAAQCGHGSAVLHQVIRNGGDIAQRSVLTGHTALFAAVVAKHRGAVEYLLDVHRNDKCDKDASLRANLPAFKLFGQTEGTALHAVACLAFTAFDGPDVVKMFARAQAKMMPTMSNGMTPLHCAAVFGHKLVLEQLIDVVPKAAKTAMVEAPTVDGATALFLAAASGQFGCVCALLSRGASAAVTDRLGRSPLGIAVDALIMKRRSSSWNPLVTLDHITETIKALEEHERTLDPLCPTFFAAAAAERNDADLKYQCLQGSSTSSSAAQCDVGAPASTQQPSYPPPPPPSTAAVPFVQLMIDNGGIDLAQCYCNAAVAGDVNLLQRFANVSRTHAFVSSGRRILTGGIGRGKRYTAVEAAVVAGSVPATQFFLSTMKCSTIVDQMPLIVLAARFNQEKIIGLLISAGANVNALSSRSAESEGEGVAALHAAQTASVVAKLIEAGADVNRRSVPNDATPLHHAVMANNAEVAEALATAGADIKAVTKLEGTTPVAMAKGRNDKQMARAIRRAARHAGRDDDDEKSCVVS